MEFEGAITNYSRGPVDDREFEDEFTHAVSSSPSRNPEWYVLRYVALREKLLLKLLDRVGLAFHHLQYDFRVPRSKEWAKRAWLPGYMFVEFDRRLDGWGQILRMPYALEVLGDPTPLPLGMIDDLVSRLPSRLAKPSEISCMAHGTLVRVRRGSYEGHKAAVTWSDRRRIKIMLMMFGRPTEVTIDVSDVEIV